MSKKNKDLTSGVVGILGQLNEKEEANRPIDTVSIETKEAIEETRRKAPIHPGRPKGSGDDNFVRMTFAVHKDELAKFRYMGRKMGVTTKVLMLKAMIGIREKYEAKYGVIDLTQIKDELENL